MSNTEAQKPSEHAMNCAKKLYPYGTSMHMVSDIKELEAGVRRDQEAKAYHIDTHAIRPAVEEAVREHKAQIAELVEALAKLEHAGHTLTDFFAPGPIPPEEPTVADFALANWNDAEAITRAVLAKHERSAS